MRMIVVAALLAGCAPAPAGVGVGAGVTAPIGAVAGPSGSISRRCVPQPNGLLAECRPL